jgi:hypothetical protein
VGGGARGGGARGVGGVAAWWTIPNRASITQCSRNFITNVFEVAEITC